MNTDEVQAFGERFEALAHDADPAREIEASVRVLTEQLANARGAIAHLERENEQLRKQNDRLSGHNLNANARIKKALAALLLLPEA